MKHGCWAALLLVSCGMSEDRFVPWPMDEGELLLVFRQEGPNLRWQSTHVGRPVLRYDLSQADVFAVIVDPEDLVETFTQVDLREEALVNIEVVDRPVAECAEEISEDSRRIRIDVPAARIYRLDEASGMFEDLTAQRLDLFDRLQLSVPISGDACRPIAEPERLGSVAMLSEDESQYLSQVELVGSSIYATTLYGLYRFDDGLTRYGIDLTPFLPANGRIWSIGYLGEVGSHRRFILIVQEPRGERTSRWVLIDDVGTGFEWVAQGPERPRLYDVAVSPGGQVALLASDRQILLGTVTSTTFRDGATLSVGQPEEVRYASSGELVLATNSAVVFSPPDLMGAMTEVRLRTEGGLPAASDITGMFESNGEWFVLTQSQGIFRFRRNSGTALPMSDNLPIPALRCFSRDCLGEPRFREIRQSTLVEGRGRQLLTATESCTSIAAIDLDTGCRSEIVLASLPVAIASDGEQIVFARGRALFRLPLDAFSGP